MGVRWCAPRSATATCTPPGTPRPTTAAGATRTSGKPRIPPRKESAMSERSTEPALGADFDAVYRGEPPVPGSGFWFDRAPWDLGEPQPVLVELEAAGWFGGRILDVGCGSGDNSIFLAERGYSVTGVDGSSAGLAQARERARKRGVDVDFFVDDATEL